MMVADYILNFFAQQGVSEIFMVTGGQAMFLNDAVCKNKNFHVICTHHEQTAGMAADAYGRIANKPAIAMVTAGPGSVNVVNGVIGGYTDSSPMIVISGQSNLSNVIYQEKTGIRQYGVQGINIRPLVEKAVKFFVTVDDPKRILFYLQKAFKLATSGRPGPVWLDVPMDIQKMQVPSGDLEQYHDDQQLFDKEKISKDLDEVVEYLKNAKRPILLAGQGVRLSGAAEEFVKVVTKLGIPVLTSRLGIDLIESDNRLYVGRPGTYGERSANFAIQNSDLMLVVGCRLATSLIGHNPIDFGRNSKKIVVDIDQKELDKPGLNIDLKIHCDAKYFLQELFKKINTKDCEAWIKQCNEWKAKYPVLLPSYEKEVPVNSYYFMDALTAVSKPNDVVLVDTGSCFHVASQAWKIKHGQRFLTTGGLSSMGYWVAGIGACVANNRNNTIVITGDGSLQMNIQEMATIKHNKLPIKVFIFNNNGYLLIRHTQKNFMDSRMIGEGPESGVWCPDSLKIAEAYGIKGVRIDSIKDIKGKILEVLNYDGPVICDIMTPEWQLLMPRVASEKLADGTMVSKPYEDMFPFLDPEELKANIIIPK